LGDFETFAEKDETALQSIADGRVGDLLHACDVARLETFVEAQEESRAVRLVDFEERGDDLGTSFFAFDDVRRRGQVLLASETALADDAARIAIDAPEREVARDASDPSAQARAFAGRARRPRERRDPSRLDDVVGRALVDTEPAHELADPVGLGEKRLGARGDFRVSRFHAKEILYLPIASQVSGEYRRRLRGSAAVAPLLTPD
jgi:hypothetical protein